MRDTGISKLLGRTAAAGFALILLIAGLIAGATASRADEPTLYDDLGGKDGITKIVGYAVDAYAADPRLSAQFDNINFDWLKNRISLQFCQLTGGPCKYPGRDMYATHKGLHIDTASFNAVVEDLQGAMDKADIPFRTQNRLLALLAPMKKKIVSQ
jgi:hemoglobin